MGAETPYLLDKTTGNVKPVSVGNGPPRITSAKELDKLPIGALFTAPDGTIQQKKA